MTAERRATRALLPFAAMMFLGYGAVGLPLQVLPVFVHVRLGYGTLVVGIVVGLAAAATLLTRQVAGGLADRRGPKRVALAGLAVTALAGGAYAAAAVLPPGAALWMLLFGRLVLGLGDSLFTTALMAWCIGSVGMTHAGRVMSWTGLAMYGSLAVMAPLGEALNQRIGFGAVACAVVASPLMAGVVALVLPGVPGATGRRPGFGRVFRAIWPLCTGLVLASSGFGTISAFLALRYLALGWPGAGLALASYSVMYILCRLLFSGLPDRMGGARVALACLAIQAVGLLLIALAGWPWVALVGSATTGVGYSLVFPSLGVEAVRRVPAGSHGVALGLMLAGFDLGLGAAGPVTGLVGAAFGLPSAFVAAALASVVSIVLVNGARGRERGGGAVRMVSERFRDADEPDAGGMRGWCYSGTAYAFSQDGRCCRARRYDDTPEEVSIQHYDRRGGGVDGVPYGDPLLAGVVQCLLAETRTTRLRLLLPDGYQPVDMGRAIAGSR